MWLKYCIIALLFWHFCVPESKRNFNDCDLDLQGPHSWKTALKITGDTWTPINLSKSKLSCRNISDGLPLQERLNPASKHWCLSFEGRRLFRADLRIRKTQTSKWSLRFIHIWFEPRSRVLTNTCWAAEGQVLLWMVNYKVGQRKRVPQEVPGSLSVRWALDLLSIISMISLEPADEFRCGKSRFVTVESKPSLQPETPLLFFKISASDSTSLLIANVVCLAVSGHFIRVFLLPAAETNGQEEKKPTD